MASTPEVMYRKNFLFLYFISPNSRKVGAEML